MKPPLLALAVSLVLALAASAAPAPAPPASSEGPALTVTVETLPAPSAAHGRACTVTVAGRHGGTTGEVTVAFNESQVRTRVGWWARLAGGGERALLTLRPGQSFSEAFDLDLGCNAHRRYRFVFTHEGTEHTHVYPSEDDFTQETSIDLGAVSRFFGIAPGVDIEPPPATLEGLVLEGEWVRSESNNDPNDGMRITVEGDRAVMTFVPASAHSTWREGETIWREIEDDGALRVLGSDGNYYPGELTPSGPNRLTLAVRHGGAGNDQTWVRTGGCWPDDYMADYGSSTPDMWVRFSTALPDGLQTALRAARDAGAAIQTVALTPAGEWVVVAANRPCYSAGFPGPVREWIDQYIASGREIDVVAFGPGGRWLVVAEDYLRRSGNVPDAVMEEIRRAQEQNRRLTSFAFSNEPDEGWIFTAGGAAYRGPAADRNVWAAVAAANAGQRPIHEIAIAPDGSWVLVAEDWYASSGLPASLLERMEQYRTDETRRIDHVVLHPDGGQTLWAMVSNQPEPDPTASDLINLVEHGLPGDSTIYQRMKLHRVTGLSIAVVQNNQVAWARGYGLREVALPESYVHPNTVFDAASISKAVTGAAVLQLVDRGALGLTEVGVLLDLADDELPSRQALLEVRADSIHLAHLLHHCAGLDNAKGVSGAEGYFMQAHLPTLAEMFLGEAPAGTDNRIVKVDSIGVGEMFDYSGANSLLIQALIERHADGGYDGQMARLLDDLNMRSSTFATDFWETMARERFAQGHTVATDGTIVSTDVRIYPNQAAAGLRTTASELAQFAIMLNQNGTYDGRTILEPATLDQFIGRDGIGAAIGVEEAACASSSSMRLHIRADNLSSTTNQVVRHGGLHNGYLTFLYSLPQQQAGVVILSTGSRDDTGAFTRELRDALSSTYGWPTLN